MSGSRGVVPLTDEVSWVAESFPLASGRCVHVSVYLIRVGDRHVLVDSGSFHHRARIQERLEHVIGPGGIDALILSHSDYPHSGNIGAFRTAWGDFEIVASSADAAIQGLPYARRSRIGGTLNVAGRTFAFIDPPLADRSHTSWIYDTTSKVMFAADGLGYHHRPEETGRTSRELVGFRDEDVESFHRDTLVWLRYVDPERLMSRIRAMFDAHPVEWVAPIHGNPIHGADLNDYLDALERGVHRIAGEYGRVGADPPSGTG